jgi:hypothetical protein
MTAMITCFLFPRGSKVVLSSKLSAAGVADAGGSGAAALGAAGGGPKPAAAPKGLLTAPNGALGAVAGALLGGEIGRGSSYRRSGTGTIIGAGAGALIGREIDRGNCNDRRYRR